MKQDLSIGLLGLGTVGTGVVKLIEQHQEELVHQLGCQIKVKKVLIRNVEKVRDVQIDPTSITTNPEDVLNDPVGLAPSNLPYSSIPNFSDNRSNGTKGVFPSCNVKKGVFSVIGKNASYCFISPGQFIIYSLLQLDNSYLLV